MARERRTLHALIRSESSVSEVLATVLLVAMTVVLMGGFGLVVLTSANETRDPPSASFALAADEGGAHVDLRLVAGSAFRLDAADVVLLVNGTGTTGATELLDADADGTLRPGGTLRVHLSSGTLPPEAQLMVLVVDRETGKPIGATVATLLGEGTTPPFVTGTPAVGAVAFDPATLTVDGESLTNVTVSVVSPFGLDLVRSLTVNLTRVGGPAEVALLDDGQGPDLLAGDGVYAAQLAAVAYPFATTPSSETATLSFLLRDVFGKTATGEGALTLETAPLSKVGTGAKWRNLPASDAVDYVNLTALTFRDETALANDQIQLRVSDLGGTSNAWTALATFGSPAQCGGTAGILSVVLSRDGVAGNATYAPASGCLPLGGLAKLNLANPPLSLDATGAVVGWNVVGDASAFLYASAGISATNEATITFFGDSLTPSPSATGLGQADLEWARLTSNLRPTAGFTASVAGLALSVDGSASSDPEGEALTYAWQWGDGTASVSGSPTAAHAYATGGNYTVNLTVTDPKGATGLASSVVRVNRAPVASFTATTSQLSASVDSAASGDPDGDPIVRAWEWGDGQSETGGVARSHVYLAGGTYQVNLTVVDPSGATSTASRNVTVALLNAGPTATLSANVTSGLAPLFVGFTLAGSDGDGSIASWTLDYGDGTSTSGTGLPATLTKQYASGGTYQATLTVTDDLGATGASTVAIAVNQAPTPGLAANVTAGTAPLAVRYSLSGTDADGSIASWMLSFGDGSSATGVGLPATQDRTYAAAGTYQANLTVTDDRGASATTSVTVSANARPTATLSANRTSGAAPLAVDLALGGSDPDGSIASWTLDFGDGTQATGTALPLLQGKTYNASGTYVATLTVTDSLGATHAASVTITVSQAPNVAPSATLAANATSGTAPHDVALGLGGSDADGSVVSWTLAYGDGTSETGATLPATRAKQYAARGTYQANLTVTDDRGGSATASVTITVNERPTASFLVAGTNGLQVDVDAGASSDADGSVVLYDWQWGDGSSSTTTSPTTSKFYAVGGTYAVNLTVTDDRGATSARASRTVTPNQAPVIASVTQTGGDDLNATLTTSASDADGHALTYTYAWGDATSPTSGASPTTSHAYAIPGNYTVTVYANDTMGATAIATRVVSVTQTLYAGAVDASFASPGGSVTGIASLGALDGATANFTESNSGSTVSAVSGCDSTFTTSAPLSCTLAALTWKVNATSTGGLGGWTAALDASQGTPTADGALSFSPTANGANTGRLNYHFNLTGAAGTTLTRLSLDWKMTANGGTGVRSITGVLVAPNGTSVTIGTNSTTTTTGWGTFTGSVSDNFLTAPGTYLLRIDYLSNKNGDVLNLDNLYLNWTASNTYRLQKELTIAPAPAASGLSHHLEIVARQSANHEALHVQVHDGATWTTRATVSSGALSTYVVKLTAAEVDGGTIRVRLADATTSSDASASSWLVDTVRVVVRGAS